jgi:serine/threonine protein phosphatase 1
VFLKKISNLNLTSRRIIIGDVHGYCDALFRLLEAIAVNSDDRVYLLGDLIDRGEQSRQVVNFIFQNSDQYRCILGNHEHMLLKALGETEVSEQWLQAWLHSGGAATLISYNHQIPEEHLDWFKSLPTYIDLGDFWLVHAGVHPDYPLAQQTREQFCWIRDEFHAMTKPYFADKVIITGHTLTFAFPEVKPGKIARGVGWLDIETGAYHPKSYWLTALDITNNQVYQVHTQNQKCRILPLEKALTAIDPKMIVAKLNKLSQNQRIND